MWFGGYLKKKNYFNKVDFKREGWKDDKDLKYLEFIGLE